MTHDTLSLQGQRGTEVVRNNQYLGELGERMAARYLEMRGYRIIDRNWRHARGELDLIASDGTTVVAVEVKTRRGSRFGHPFEAITREKASRCRTLLNEWALEHRGAYAALRVDGVAIILNENGRNTVEHLKAIG